MVHTHHDHIQRMFRLDCKGCVPGFIEPNTPIDKSRYSTFLDYEGAYSRASHNLARDLVVVMHGV